MSGKMFEEHLLHEFFVRRTQYLGLIRAVIFDWAGTGVDCGSLAPVAAFSSTFSDFGLTLSKEEIRAYMGLEKKNMCVVCLCRNISQIHGQSSMEVHQQTWM